MPKNRTGNVWWDRQRLKNTVDKRGGADNACAEKRKLRQTRVWAKASQQRVGGGVGEGERGGRQEIPKKNKTPKRAIDQSKGKGLHQPIQGQIAEEGHARVLLEGGRKLMREAINALDIGET